MPRSPFVRISLAILAARCETDTEAETILIKSGTPSEAAMFFSYVNIYCRKMKKSTKFNKVNLK